MNHASAPLLAALATLAFSTQAAAEPPPGGYYDDPNAPVIVSDPNAPPPGGAPAASGPTTVVVEEGTVETAEQGRGIQYGATLWSPIGITDYGDATNPGIGVHGRIGWEFGRGLSAELGIGIGINGADPGDGTFLQVPIMAGLRYGILNPSALVPYVQGGAHYTLWNLSSDFIDVEGSALGFYAGAGVIWEINPKAAVELGMNVYGHAPNDFFAEFEVILSPTVGFTLYY